MNNVYTTTNLSDIPSSKRYVFVFCEEKNIEKLATAPNVSMQLGYFDENLPIVFILTEPELETIYERVIPPNAYLVTLDKKILSKIHASAWEYVFNYCIEHETEYALFAEWYSVLSMSAGKETFPINMDKNPCYVWEGETPHIDFSSWLDTMCMTMESHKLSSLGVNRRHATDLLRFADPLGRLNEVLPYIPIQLVMYNFTQLKSIDCPVWLNTHTENCILRDTVVAMLITSLGGEVDTTDEFIVNAPSVVYSEDDLHQILTLSKRFPSLLRRNA